MDTIVSDGFFSAKAAEFEDPATFHRSFIGWVHPRGAEGENESNEYRRYLASLNFARPEALMAWGRASAELGKTGKFAADFLSLSCPKLYYWGAESTPQETQAFLDENRVPNLEFSNSGHWPMVSIPHQCYFEIDRFFAGLLEAPRTAGRR